MRRIVYINCDVLFGSLQRRREDHPPLVSPFSLLSLLFHLSTSPLSSPLLYSLLRALLLQHVPVLLVSDVFTLCKRL
jgi:hypothetical protein